MNAGAATIVAILVVALLAMFVLWFVTRCNYRKAIEDFKQQSKNWTAAAEGLKKTTQEAGKKLSEERTKNAILQTRNIFLEKSKKKKKEAKQHGSRHQDTTSNRRGV
jgi:F0F1-type ATP synthase membrane subunit b/b'